MEKYKYRLGITNGGDIMAETVKDKIIRRLTGKRYGRYMFTSN